MTDRKTGGLTRVGIEGIEETLVWGDYLCPDARHAVVIERKKNLRELCGNLLIPSRRASFIRELQNLRDRACFPWLILEGSIRDIEEGPGDPVKNTKARDLLLDALHTHRVSFMNAQSRTQAQRKALGRWVAATIYSGVIHAESPCCDGTPRA